MEWRSSPGEPVGRNGSLDYLDRSRSERYRGISPFGRPPGRLDYQRPRERLQRNFSDDFFSSEDENSLAVPPPSKRRPPPKYIGFANSSDTSRQSPPGKNELQVNGGPVSYAGVKVGGDAVSRLDESKYAASSTSGPKRSVDNLPKTSDESLLKSLLVPTTPKSTPVARKPPIIAVRRVQRASWNHVKKPDQPTLPSTSAPVPPTKVIARSTGSGTTTVTTLSQVQENSKEWWKIGGGSDDESDVSEKDEVDEIIGKIRRGKSPPKRARPVRLFTVDDPMQVSPKKESLALPELATQDEKDLLGDIFDDLRKDYEMKASVPEKDISVATPVGQNKLVNSSKAPIVISDSDAESVGSSELGGPSTSMTVHMNLGKLPVYNATTFTNSPADSLPTPTVPAAKSFANRFARTQPVKMDRQLDYFSLNSVMKALPENLSHWKVSKQDAMRAHGQYLQQREDRERLLLCHRCGVDMATSKRHFCPVSCTLCYGTGHWKDKCPFKDTINTLTCRRCGLTGHVDAICPEQWRQYHNTVSHSDPIKNASTTKDKKFACCFNCGNADHYGHECRRRPFDRCPRPAPSHLISSYDPPKQLHQLGTEVDQHPLDEFHEFVTNNLTAGNAEVLNGTPRSLRKGKGARTGSLSPKGRAKSASGSPKKKSKKKKIRNLV